MSKDVQITREVIDQALDYTPRKIWEEARTKHQDACKTNGHRWPDGKSAILHFPDDTHTWDNKPYTGSSAVHCERCYQSIYTEYVNGRNITNENIEQFAQQIKDLFTKLQKACEEKGHRLDDGRSTISLASSINERHEVTQIPCCMQCSKEVDDAFVPPEMIAFRNRLNKVDIEG